MTRRLALPAALATVVVLTACQTPPPTSPEVVGEFRAGSGYLKGYLDRKQLPDSLALLPKPPADGSPQQLADLATHRATRALRDTPRWQLADSDAKIQQYNYEATKESIKRAVAGTPTAAEVVAKKGGAAHPFAAN